VLPHRRNSQSSEVFAGWRARHPSRHRPAGRPPPLPGPGWIPGPGRCLPQRSAPRHRSRLAARPRRARVALFLQIRLICVTKFLLCKIPQPKVCKSSGQGMAGKSMVTLDHKTWLQAHRYVLFNYANIEPYLDKYTHYLTSIGVRNQRDISRMKHESFHEWFRSHVSMKIT